MAVSLSDSIKLIKPGPLVDGCTVQALTLVRVFSNHLKMKTSTFFTALTLASGAFGQVQTLIDVVNKIAAATTDLDNAIKAYNGGDASTIISASDNVNSVVTAGVATANGATAITLNDALTLTPIVQTLSTTVDGTINDLIAKKTQIVAAGQGQKTEDTLVTQLAGAQALSKAISSKVPPDLSTIATQLSQSISDSIQKGVDAFKGTGSGTPSSSSSAPTAPSSTASSSASMPMSSSTTVAGSTTPIATKTTGTVSATTSTGAAPSVFTGAANSLNNGLVGAGLALAAALVI